MTTTDLTGSLHFVCGCSGTHVDGCTLGPAEVIAYAAADDAHAHGAHPLIAALTALLDAGLLRPMGRTGSDDDELLNGALDLLFESGLIGRTS